MTTQTAVAAGTQVRWFYADDNSQLFKAEVAATSGLVTCGGVDTASTVAISTDSKVLTGSMGQSGTNGAAACASGDITLTIR